MEKLKLLSDVIGTWVTIIGAFAGGIFALIQYTDQISSARVQETLKYVARFDNEPLHNASARLEAFWNPRAEKVFEKQAEGEPVLFAYIDSEIRNNKLENDAALLFAFFESLRTCTCAKLCDESSARKFFGKQAYDLYGVLFPYMVTQRDRLKDKSFGTGVESLAKSYRNEKLNTYCVVNPTQHFYASQTTNR